MARGKECALSLVLAVLALAAGLLVLFVTFWLAYAVIFIAMDGISAACDLTFGTRVHLSHKWRLIMSFTFVLLLFPGNARRTRNYFTEYPPKLDPRSNLATKYGRLAADVSILTHPVLTAKLITDLLFTGPRLITVSARCFRRSARCLKSI